MSVKHVIVCVDSEYLTSCARIRNMTMAALVRELVNTIEQDQLVLAILDDDGQHQRKRYERPFTASLADSQ